jgi:ubiquinone biosynthesis accessory factor UbiK
MSCESHKKSSKITNSNNSRQMAINMALKPPPLGDVLQQVNEMVGSSGLVGEVDKSARAFMQSTLNRLDVVSRDEFDTQSEILLRTRERVAELEAQLESLTQELDDLTAK